MFFERLQTACANKGVSLSKLASNLGLSSASATYWRKGTIPGGSTIKKMAEYLGVSTEYLLPSNALTTVIAIDDETGEKIGEVPSADIAAGFIESKSLKIEMLRLKKELADAKKTIENLNAYITLLKKN